MKQRRSRASFISSFAAVGAVGTAATRSTLAAESYTLRCGVNTPPTSAFVTTAVSYASNVHRVSNGQLTIEVYPSGQIAKEQESIDGLVSGTLDLAVQQSGFLVPLVPRMQVLDLPFIFKDLASGYRVLDGPIGNELFADLETKGIIGLCWGPPGGFKQIETAIRTVTTPDDMKGLRLRCQPSAIYISTYQALGAFPLAIDVSETFTALTQHTIEGLDLSLDAFTTQKFATAVKHIAISNHFFSVDAILASKKKVDALPAPLQKILRDEAKKGIAGWRNVFAKQIIDDIEILKKAGVTFTDIQVPAFRKVVEPVYASYQNRVGPDLIARIRRAAG